MALTRPLGEVYFAYPEDLPWLGGPSINLAQSPDGAALEAARCAGHPRAQGLTSATQRIGGGSQPVLTPRAGC